MSDILQNKLYSILGDGSRPTRFRIQLMPPQQLLSKYKLQMQDLDFLCTASKIPGITTQVIDFKFKGRNIPMRGIQEYDQTWSCTFYNHENHNLRQLMIDWMLSGQNHNYFENASTLTKVDIDLTMLHVFGVDYQMDKDCVVYSMVNAFPKSVSELEYNSESLSQVHTFQVEFGFTHFEINSISGKGLTANDIADKIQAGIQKIANNIIDSATKAVKNKLVDPLINTFANSRVGKYINEATESFDDFIDS